MPVSATKAQHERPPNGCSARASRSGSVQGCHPCLADCIRGAVPPAHGIHQPWNTDGLSGSNVYTQCESLHTLLCLLFHLNSCNVLQLWAIDGCCLLCSMREQHDVRWDGSWPPAEAASAAHHLSSNHQGASPSKLAYFYPCTGCIR